MSFTGGDRMAGCRGLFIGLLIVWAVSITAVAAVLWWRLP